MSNTERCDSTPLVEYITSMGHHVGHWEWIATRMPVPGGWQVANTVLAEEKCDSFGLSTVFVADRDWSWNIDIAPPIEDITPQGEHWVGYWEWTVTKMPVPGGWLVSTAAVDTDKWESVSLSSIFVSDPDGSWKISDPLPEAMANLEARILGRPQ